MTDLRRVRILSYLIGVPSVAVVHFLLFLSSYGEAFAAGEDGGSAPFLTGAIAVVLGFPFFFLLMNDSFVDSLRPALSDNQMVYVVTSLNSIFWGFALVSVWVFIHKRKHVHRHS